MNADEKYNLIRSFKTNFKYEPSFFACAPGRVELLGNHTDHQGGVVLATSTNLFMRTAFSTNQTNIINIISKGYAPIKIDYNAFDGKPNENEFGTTISLVRGIINEFAKSYTIRGFDAYIETSVLPGSGLSSSAAFEILIGRILNILFANEKETAINIAKIGQIAENHFFGKPSGLMDQIASSIGGIVYIDFHDNKNPKVENLLFNFADAGYALCVIDSKSSHENLTNEYSSIPNEMKIIANAFGKELLSELNFEEVFEDGKDVLVKIEKEFGLRPALRALHYFEEIDRVKKAFEGLKNNDIKPFINAVNESGKSSLNKLQNILPESMPKNDTYFRAYTFVKDTLNKITTEGALRINGGGFAGTLLAVVPLENLDEFSSEIQKSYPITIL